MGMLERLLATIILVVMTSQRWPYQVDAFNIDTLVPEILHGENKSQFGYSVALWSDMNKEQSLVVGAPRGTKATAANHTYVLGNIYMCKPMGTSDDDKCKVREDLPRLDTKDWSQQAIYWVEDVYKKQGIGFGQTLFAHKEERTKMVACAPRYPRMNDRGKEPPQLQTRGACFILRSRTEKAEKALAYQKHGLANDDIRKDDIVAVNNYQYAGFAQAGFSAALSKDSISLFVGGPSAFRSNGVLVGMRKKKKWYKIKSTRQAWQQSDDVDMEGWATVTARFNGRKELIATSCPEHNFKGMVKIYKDNLRKDDGVVNTLMGYEIGSKFGFSLCVGDFNGDGMDDLAVGAPFSSTQDHSQDSGKVYIYYTPQDKTNNMTEIKGQHPWGRFGQSLTSPGDLNMDGYDDLAVGAPYTFGGRGSVFIYNGHLEGLKPNPSQVIHASAFPFTLSWFGFSLHGGLDFDGNEYPDLLVGAPGSDKAVFLRSGPVISLTGGIEFNSTLIPMDKASCSIGMSKGIRKDVVCFNLLINLQYEANHITDPLPFRFNMELDRGRRRVAFMDNNDHTYTSIQNVSHVDAHPEPLVFRVYVKPNVRRLNLADNVVAELQVSLSQPPRSRTRKSNDRSQEASGDAYPFSSALNVLSAYSNTSFSNQTTFQCPDITLCVTRSDLVINAKDPEQLVVGDGTRTIEITLEIKNNTAYSVSLNMTVPSVLKYMRAQSAEYLPECKTLGKNGSHDHLTCKFPSEIPVDVKASLNFTFKHDASSLLEYGQPDLHFGFVVSSDTTDLQPSDNSLEICMSMISEAVIAASGWSNPDSVKGKLYETIPKEHLLFPEHQRNISDLTPDSLGPAITHHYVVHNKGPSPLIRGKIVLGLPLELEIQKVKGLHLRDHIPLLYLATLISTTGNLICSQPKLNPLNFSRFRQNYEVEGSSSSISNSQDDLPHPEEDPSLENQTETEEEQEEEDDILEENQLRRKRSLPTTLDDPSSIPQTTSPRYPTEDSRTSINTEHQITTPATKNPKEKAGTRKKQELRLNCNNVEIECQEIECDLSNLMAEDQVTIEIKAYVTVGALHTLHKKRLIIESSMALYTSQPNVILNDHPAVKDGSPSGADAKEEDNGTNKTDDATEDFSTNMTDGTTDDFSNNMTNDTTEDFSTNMTDFTTEDFSTNMTDDTTEDFSNNMTDSTTEDFSTNMTDDTTEDFSTNMTDSTTEDFSTIMTDRTIEDLVSYMTGGTTEDLVTYTGDDNIKDLSTSGTTPSKGDSSVADSDETTETTSTGKNEGSTSPSAEVDTRYPVLNKAPKRKYDVTVSTYIQIIKKREHKDINPREFLEIHLWIVILAVMGSLMLIIIVVAILHQIGFFKRKRISVVQRKELARSIKRRSTP